VPISINHEDGVQAEEAFDGNVGQLAEEVLAEDDEALKVGYTIGEGEAAKADGEETDDVPANGTII
jgi:hypothetical protein